MRASELRIGNYLSYISSFEKDGELYIKEHSPVVWISEDSISLKGMNNGDYGLVEEVMKPIPLTEEWLLRFGFEKDGWHGWYNIGLNKPLFGSKSLSYNIKRHIFEIDPDAEIQITHVHSLQNLFFALTGEELKLKENE